MEAGAPPVLYLPPSHPFHTRERGTVRHTRVPPSPSLLPDFLTSKFSLRAEWPVSTSLVAHPSRYHLQASRCLSPSISDERPLLASSRAVFKVRFPFGNGIATIRLGITRAAGNWARYLTYRWEALEWDKFAGLLKDGVNTFPIGEQVRIGSDVNVSVRRHVNYSKKKLRSIYWPSPVSSSVFLHI